MKSHAKRIAWTFEETREALGCGRRQLREAMKREDHPIPHIYIGNRPRFYPDAVKRWLAGEAVPKPIRHMRVVA